MEICLNGNWSFRECGTEAWAQAVVPGCNYLDLMRNGVLPDPFIGTNEKDAYWVARKDWEYGRDFEVSEEMLLSDRVILRCAMLDTLCDVFVNGKLAGSGENAHLQYEFNVKPYLIVGKNDILIRFFSPVNYVRKEQAKRHCPANNNGQNGITLIRKPQCHFGWDWGPVLPPSGISGDISLVAYRKARIFDFKIGQIHADGKVSVVLEAESERFGCGSLSYTAKVLSPDGTALYANGVADGKISVDFCIDKPQLWWTNDLSDQKEQPLYTVSLSIKDGDEILDVCEKKIGLRTLILNREKDQYGENCQFVLNGKPLFIKGANWIPSDSFINREDETKLRYYIDAALFSNLNMFRIWGGGYYCSDLMAELCDRYGILIWQDFMFACQAYPFFIDSLRENILREAEYNVKRLRHHASLAIWSGNNEIEQMLPAWLYRRKYIRWNKTFFYDILPVCVQANDGVTPYIPGSPYGSAFLENVSSDDVGDTHLWQVWHGLQPMTYYRTRLTRFCSEFGFESLPDIKTIRKFAGAGGYSLASEVFNAHQKCKSGNMKMVYYISTRFRLPVAFEDYIYLSQVAQQECVKDATEHWRRNKGRCNGAMYWQLDDCWPVCSWASVDYYGNYKALMYTSRRFNAPFTVSIQNEADNAKVVVVNDTLKEKKALVRCRLMRFDGQVLIDHTAELCVPPIENYLAYDLDKDTVSKIKDIRNTVLVADLYENGALLTRSTALFAYEKDIDLPAVNITKEVSVKDGNAVIRLTSDKFARLVFIQSESNPNPLSDNFFDLLPGESVTVTQPLDRDYDDSLADHYTVKTISGIPCDTDPESLKSIENKAFPIPMTEKRIRQMVFSKPRNMVMALIYKLGVK